MTNGSVTVNGITDEDMVIIFEAKKRHEGKFQFGPQQLKPTNLVNPSRPGYDNAVFAWSNQAGFEVVMELLHRLSPETPCHHHKEPAVP
jgi:hypothetical protein